MIIIHAGNYRRDDGDHEEYIEGNYPFELFASSDMEIATGDDVSTEIDIKWIDREPFRNSTEKETIEKKIIKKFKNKFLKDE
jgi:hypothetical protein